MLRIEKSALPGSVLEVKKDGLATWSFTVKTIDRYRGHEESQKNLLPLNLFFAQLSDSDQDRIYQFYQECKIFLTSFYVRYTFDPNNIVDKLNMLVGALVVDIDLINKLVTFTQGCEFIYPIFEGYDPHHHDDRKVFSPLDYPNLTAMSILAKLIMPVWGDFEHLPKCMKDVKPPYKSVMMARMMIPFIVASVLKATYQKIVVINHFYGDRALTKALRANTSSMAAGSELLFARNQTHTIDVYAEACATVLVKRLAVYNPVDDNALVPNVGSFVTTGMERYMHTRCQLILNNQ